MNNKIHIGVGFALYALAAVSKAGTVYDNYHFSGLPESGRIIEGPSVHNVADVDQAARFNTGGLNRSGITVSAVIQVDNPANNPFDGRGPLKVSVYSDSTGPGVALASNTLNITAYDQQEINTTFGGLMLAANTDYWVVLDGQTTFDGAWDFNNTGAMGATSGRSNGGAWNVHDPDTQYSLRVVSRLDSVPEPAPFVALGVGALALLRRRRS